VASWLATKSRTNGASRRHPAVRRDRRPLGGTLATDDADTVALDRAAGTAATLADARRMAKEIAGLARACRPRSFLADARAVLERISCSRTCGCVTQLESRTDVPTSCSLQSAADAGSRAEICSAMPACAPWRRH
jgi:hypothetical protein